jgi:hypothetical protein
MINYKNLDGKLIITNHTFLCKREGQHILLVKNIDQSFKMSKMVLLRMLNTCNLERNWYKHNMRSHFTSIIRQKKKSHFITIGLTSGLVAGRIRNK